MYRFSCENKCFKILMVVYFVCFCQTSASDFFIAKKYDINDNYVCVTNSSYSMSWIQEEIKTRLSYAPFFIPATIANNFDSIISVRDARTIPFVRDPWSLVNNSLNLEVNEIILDRRWEGLGFYLTEFVDRKNAYLKYQPVVKNLKGNFKIPLSIRLKQEGHIFLCDGDYPPNSNCYWLMLQAWSGKRSAIRKCDAGYIPSQPGKYPIQPCSNILSESDHENDPNSLYFSNQKWSHFKLTKKEHVLSLFSVNNNKKKKIILNLEDKKNPIGVTHMIIHSKQFNGLWKIHNNLEFIYTKEESSRIHLGNPIYPQGNHLCINFFIAMCSSCTLTVTLEDYRNNVIEEKVYKYTSPEWLEIKFTTENIRKLNNPIKFLVSTSSRSLDRFWAIDDIRICQKKEFRAISLSENATCQLMSEDDNVIFVLPGAKRLNSSCPENTIGDFCVPCKWVFNKCEQIEVCQKDRCVCSAGYRLHKGYMSDYECYSECDSSYYGHGCLKQCPNCLHSKCNHIDGTCNYQGQCLNDYTGPKCDTRPALIFEKPPETLEVNYFDAVFIVRDFTIQKGVPEEPENYFFQYKKVGVKNISEWTKFGSEIKFNQSKEVTIKNLEAETKYFVRAVIVSDKKISYETSYVKFSYFETKCDELTKDDVMTQPSNTSAIILQKDTKKLCNFYRYNVQAMSNLSPTKSVIEPKRINGTALYFENLKEFTRYTVTFKGTFQIQTKFRTTEGIPDVIEDLKFTEVLSTTIKIQWSKPNEIKGTFKYYVLEYGIVSYLACGKTLTDLIKTRLTFQNTTANLTNLIPYATYSFYVSVANTVFESAPRTIEITTKASDNITSEEIPTIEKLASTSTALLAHIKMKCDKVRGPLMVKASAVCSDEWCDNTRELKTFINIVSSNSFYLNNLVPFSNYTLHLQSCRNQTYCRKERLTQYFKTLPAAPNPVGDLLVYSKNENSVSLRWTPPYPPNGILEKYYIKWGKLEDSKFIEINHCKLWSTFHCATIDGLEKNTSYTFYVHAQNKEPETYGTPRSVSATTKKEAPEPPYDLTIDWTLQNDLELKWKHPNQSNGEIRFFYIHLDCEGRLVTGKLEIVDNMYELIYNYTIKSIEIKPSANCKIIVSANNGIQGESTNKSDTSPPAIPELEEDLKISAVDNKTTTVEISPKRTQNGVRFLVLISKENTTLDNFKLVFNCSLNKSLGSFEITIGDNKQPNGCENTENPSLQPATKYFIAVELINTFAQKSRSKIFTKLFKTTGKPLAMLHLELLGLLVLLFIPIAVVLYIKRDKIRSRKESTEVLELNEVQNPLSQNIQPQKKITKQHDYQNCTFMPSKVETKKFYNYVKTSESRGQLKKQHQIIMETLTLYDIVPGNFQVEYIDVNYNDGHQLEKVYIATQLPKKNEINRFWKIIWDENVHYIVLYDLIPNNWHQQTFEKYWPEQNENMQLNNIFIKWNASKKYQFYTWRTFTVTLNNRKKQVEQIHFSSNYTEYSSTVKYVDFFQAISNIPLDTNSPILIHSSYGMSGNCFVLLSDISLRLSRKDGVVDVMNNLKKLTKSSSQLIVNYDHYVLAHKTILEGLLYKKTSIDCDSSQNQDYITLISPQEENHSKYEYLQRTWWLDYHSSNTRKTNSDQIRTISIDGLNSRGKFVVISHPSTDTISRFWNQIEDENVSLIISVNGDVSVYLHKEISSMQLSSGIIIKKINIKQFNTFEWITVKMNNIRTIEIFSMKNWPAQTILPENVPDFVNFCQETNEILKKHESIAVTCQDGLTAAGLYITMSYNIQKMKTEGISDICTCIRLIRSQCPHFFKNKNLYEFLMKAARSYENEFGLYEVR